MWSKTMMTLIAAVLLLSAQDDATKKEVEDLKRRVQELEKKQGASAQVESQNKSKITFYGFLRLDIIRDDSRAEIPGGAAQMGLIGYVRSEDPTAPAAIRAGKNGADHEQLTLHPRLSRFGMDFAGPNVGMLWEAKLSGKLEIDFYNGGSESREIPRIRHAYLKLGWDNVSFLAGQTSDCISPIFPAINADMVMWGSGNLGDRRPQIRTDVWGNIGDGVLSFAVMAGLTGADDAQSLGVVNASGALLNGQMSGVPTLQARLGYKVPFIWEKQNLDFGIWGHYAWERTDTRINNQNWFESWAAGFDLTLPLYESCLWIKVEGWMGADLDDVRGGIFQGINNRGQEIRSKGGFAELGVKPVAWWTMWAGYSTDDPANMDLTPVGVGGGNSAGRSWNRVYYIKSELTFDSFTIGFEYHYWVTEYIGGFSDGDDNRVALYFMYRF
jgi:hypothetical protein